MDLWKYVFGGVCGFYGFGGSFGLAFQHLVPERTRVHEQDSQPSGHLHPEVGSWLVGEKGVCQAEADGEYFRLQFALFSVSILK